MSNYLKLGNVTYRRGRLAARSLGEVLEVHLPMDVVMVLGSIPVVFEALSIVVAS